MTTKKTWKFRGPESVKRRRRWEADRATFDAINQLPPEERAKWLRIIELIHNGSTRGLLPSDCSDEFRKAALRQNNAAMRDLHALAAQYHQLKRLESAEIDDDNDGEGYEPPLDLTGPIGDWGSYSYGQVSEDEILERIDEQKARNK